LSDDVIARYSPPCSNWIYTDTVIVPFSK
jgi:hypothetical protein